MRALNAGVAQLVERLTCNEDVVGSTPISGSNFCYHILLIWLTVLLRSSKIRGLILGGVPERPKGADCKSAGSTFGGSNPPPSTRLLVERRLDVKESHHGAFSLCGEDESRQVIVVGSTKSFGAILNAFRAEDFRSIVILPFH